MSLRKLIWVGSDPATHFKEATADGAIEIETLDMKDGGDIWNNQAGADAMRDYRIEAVTFASLDTGNAAMTDWRIWFFKTASAADGDGDIILHEVIGVLEFTVSSDARALVGATDIEYYTDHSIELPYFDGDAQAGNTVPRLHIGLQPIGAAAGAYADGTVERVIRVALSPVRDVI